MGARVAAMAPAVPNEVVRSESAVQRAAKRYPGKLPSRPGRVAFLAWLKDLGETAEGDDLEDLYADVCEVAGWSPAPLDIGPGLAQLCERTRHHVSELLRVVRTADRPLGNIELAAALRLTAGHTSRLVTRATAVGLVSRVKNPANRRWVAIGPGEKKLSATVETSLIESLVGAMQSEAAPKMRMSRVA